jgi:hypothetical protein
LDAISDSGERGPQMDPNDDLIWQIDIHLNPAFETVWLE